MIRSRAVLRWNWHVQVQNLIFRNGLSTRPLSEGCPVHQDQTVARVRTLPPVNYKDDVYKNARPTREIPGPKAIPGLGIMHYFMPGGRYYNMKMNELHFKLRKEFGDIVFLPGSSTLGRPDMVLCYNPDDIAMVYRNEGQFPFRRAFAVFEYFRKHERPDLFKGKAGLLSDQGEQWYETRTKVNPVMLQPKNAKKYIQPVEEIAEDFCARIRSIRDDKNETPPDFSNEMNKWALESIAVIGLDTRLGLLGDIPKDSDAQRLIQGVHDFFHLTYELEVMASIWKWYKTPAFKKLMVSLHDCTNVTSKFVDDALKRLQNKKIGDGEDGEMSVLEKLLQIDRDLAIMMVLDMLMAGVDTTSMSSISLMYHLAKNPEKQEKLREEIRTILPTKESKLTSQTMANMPYLRACIKEAARLSPVTVGGIRLVRSDVVLSGYQVPKGTEVAMSGITIMMDPQYYKDSEKFLPERFLKEHPNQEIKGKHPFVYLPFGFGPRMCIGRRFAELEMEVLICKIIRNFDIKWNHSDLQWEANFLNIPVGEMRFQFNDL